MYKRTLFILVLLLLTFNITCWAQQKQVKNPYRTSWALLIGINNYPNLPAEKQLQYAENDVLEMKRLLVGELQFPEPNVTILTGGDATLQRIIEEMGKLADSKKVGKEDRVLIYFSGHGQTVPTPRGGEMGFIIPYDAKVDMGDTTNSSSYFQTCLGMDRLKQLSELIPAKHVLFLVDACYSGLAIETNRGVLSIPSDLETVATLRVSQIITAGLKGQKSTESSNWGHGAFTYKLLEALKTGAADAEPKDGVITGMELGNYLRNVVPKISPNQTPKPDRFEGDGEFLFPLNYETGMLYIKATAEGQPTDAKVFIDDSEVGLTPYTADAIRPGTYKVIVSKPPLYHDYVEEAIVTKDQKTSLNAILELAFGSLIVESNPSDVKVELYDATGAQKGTGKTPFQIDKLPCGSYTLKLSHTFYEAWSEKVEILDGDTTRISPSLTPNFGTLDVRLTPEGSQVLVDGKNTGTTPCKLPLPPGIHSVEIVNQDIWVPRVHKVSIERGQTETLTGTLERKMGSLRVISTLPEARITIDEKDYKLTPNIIQLPTGSHKLKLSKEGFEDYEETVNIEWNKATERSIMMSKSQQMGSLQLISTPPGANITIDEKYYELTPNIIQLPAGSHKLKLSKEDFEDYEETVSIEWNKVTERSIMMSKPQQMGSLRVVSRPSGAHITIYGKDYELTPNTIQLPTGRYMLKLSKEGFADYEEVVNIEWNKITERRIIMSKPWASRVRFTLTGHEAQVWDVSFSPDGKRLVTGSNDTAAKLWDVRSGKEIFTLTGHKGAVTGVSFSPDGNYLATGSWDGTAKVWDARSGKDILTLTGHKGFVNAVSFSPDGNYLATGSRDGTAKVWDVRSGKNILTLTGHEGSVNDVSFSPDGKLLATGGGDGMVKVWDVESGREKTLKGHRDGVLSVSFSPDGKHLATSGGRDGMVKVWDVRSGKEILTLTGHNYGVLSFSPDGKHLATGGGTDGIAKVWDVESGKEILTLTEHKLLVTGVSFSPDGRHLATSSVDMTTKVWDVWPLR